MPRPAFVVIWVTAAAALSAASAPQFHRTAPPPPDTLPLVEPNDNRQPAGTLRDGLLTVNLEVGRAGWYPEGDSVPGIEVVAFAEAGGAPQIPGPLLRVPAGTVIQVTVRNTLPDSTVTLHGFVTRPAAAADTIRVPPGEARVKLFSVGAPGTYFYWAEVGQYKGEPNRAARVREREQLAGALIVDERGTTPNDRVFVVNIWGEPVDSLTYRNALAINGRSWPRTERLDAAVGDSLRWRVINASARGHPMHLHGFYYQIAAAGGALANRAGPAGERPSIVTNELRAFQTMDVSWQANRPGNWLFHCHLTFHVVPDARLDPRPDRHDETSRHADEHMAGLILGIRVRAAALAVPPAGPTRQLRMLVQEGPRRGRAPRSMGFVLQRNGTAPLADSIEVPGSPLVLTRGESARVTVVNRLREPTAVHWHGIELESYSDGVAGWSGDATRQAPLIAPQDSFTATLTLPRSGTFMYHTHLNDVEQLTSGLYGAIVVLEPGQRWDPESDHVVVLGWDGNFDPPNPVLNGDSVPPPLNLAAGRAHRLRLVNIAAAGVFAFTLARDTTLQRWRALAKDGADLPPTLQTDRPARQAITVGETYDFAFTPPAPGSYILRAAGPAGRPVSRAVVVR